MVVKIYRKLLNYEMNTRLKELRKHLNLTQQEFADILRVKRITISQLEIGRNKLTEQMIKAICRDFNVNEEWLKYGKGDMFIDLNTDEELNRFFESLILSPEDSIQKRFLKICAKLDIQDWENIEEILKKVKEL